MGPRIQHISLENYCLNHFIKNKLSHLLNTYEFKLQQFHEDRSQTGRDHDNMNQLYTTFCSPRAVCSRARLWPPVGMQAKDRGKEMASAKEKVKRRLGSQEENCFGKRLLHLSVAQRAKGCQVVGGKKSKTHALKAQRKLKAV